MTSVWKQLQVIMLRKAHFYAHLLRVSSPALSAFRQRWFTDVFEQDPEDWEDSWDFLFKILVSFQFKIVHRAHLTPYRLHKLEPARSPACWRCDHPQGDFIHIVRFCPAIALFWTQELSVIKSLVDTPIVLSPKMCPLGLTEDRIPRVAVRTVTGFLLNDARKVLTLCFKKRPPPLISFWKLQV